MSDQSPPSSPPATENDAESPDENAVAVTEAIEPSDPADEEPRAEDPLESSAAEVVSAEEEPSLGETGRLRSAIEALLFVSPEAVNIRRLSGALDDTPAKDIRDAINEMAAEYEAQGRGIRIAEVAGGYQMTSAEEFAPRVLRLGAKKKRPSLSNAALETLAIVGYRQPIIRAEVESIRGVESSGTMRNLLDIGLIAVVGRKEVIGRPQLYGTTEKFLTTFGLKNLRELPAIQGLREKFEAQKRAEEVAAQELAEAEAAAAKLMEEEAEAEADTEEAPEASAEGEVGEDVESGEEFEEDDDEGEDDESGALDEDEDDDDEDDEDEDE